MSNLHVHFTAAACCLLSTAVVATAQTIPPFRNIVEVKYGYFPEARPNHAACALGWLDLDLVETNTYYKVTCHPQTSGNFAAARLDNLQLDISNLGSTPWAMAVARNIDITVFYISHYMGDSQGLYVRPSLDDDYTGITTPFDLRGRTVGVPFGSTMHYQVLFLIDLLDLRGQVELVDLAPAQIKTAWDNQEIDAAGCWGSAREHILSHPISPAKTLASAGLLASWGRPTFVVTAATRTFARNHPALVTHVAGVLSRINDSFLDNLGQDDTENSRRWDASNNRSYVPSMTDALMLSDETPQKPSEELLFLERQVLDTFIQYSAQDQLECDYLGVGPETCPAPTLQQIATLQTAEFLRNQKVLSSLGPLDNMGTDCRGEDPTAFCASDSYDGSFLAAARQSCLNCLNVGPHGSYYGNRKVSSTVTGPDELLAALEAADAARNASPFALGEAGRTGGDSTCQGTVVLSNDNRSFDSGRFGDGANGEADRTYSTNLACKWVIRATDCDTPDQRCQNIVAVDFERFRVWSGDYLRVYTHSEFDCEGASAESMTLLGQFSGLDMFSLPPRLAAKGCITVVFNTDANQELTYGDARGNGFQMSYIRSAFICNSDVDCNGRGSCFDNMCECNGQSWGSNCQAQSACFGTTHMALGWGEAMELVSSRNVLFHSFQEDTSKRALDPELAYPNDLDCIYEIELMEGQDFVRIDIQYDLEPSFDLLYLQTGTGETAKTYAVLTGSSGVTSKDYYVPTENGKASLRLVTDTHGRRYGFRASVQGIDSGSLNGPFCLDPGRSGSGCEFEHCVADNLLMNTKEDETPYVLGRVVSQTLGWPKPGQSSVRPMPWASDGGCEWPLLRNGLPRGVEKIVALRFVFNKPFDLEPQPITAVADKLVIQKRKEDSQVETVDCVSDEVGCFFVEKCDSDEVCSFPWQTGVCGGNGGCVVKPVVEVDYTAAEQKELLKPYALLVTDRNDGGQIYKGLDLEVWLVQQCPTEAGENDCVAGGGECVDGFCLCGNIPCSCPCNGESTSVSTGVKIGVVVGVIVPIFAVLMALFLLYRRRKIRKSREQKRVIKEKDAELEAFRDSIVGMCTATKLYIPITQKEVGQERPAGDLPPKPRPVPPSVWCWKETPSCMSQHDPDVIVGNPVDCWIKYNESATARLEAAFVEQGGAGEFSPMPGYVVNFTSMIQTKSATLFQRDVKRIAGTPVDVVDTDTATDLDLSDVEFGDMIPDDLAEEPRMVLVEGDVIQISKQRQDGWAFGTKLQHADEGLARQLVVVATADNPAFDDSSILTDTGWFELDATRLPTSEDLALLHSKVGDSGELDPPEYWDPVADPTVAQLHPLSKGDPERDAVERAFMGSLCANANIISIERIQNLAMWQSYVVKRQTICYRETEQSDEDDPAKQAEAKTKALDRFERRWLWHGTNVEVKDKILQQGFNRSFCGKNATVYGKGVYFARDASYSADTTYAVRDRNGVQYVMACRVVVGEYCQGTYNALTPDLRDATKNILYDTTVGLLRGDDMKSPSIYVTYHDAQAYPEYLIAFRKN